jgi:hypothetical protein
VKYPFRILVIDIQSEKFVRVRNCLFNFDWRLARFVVAPCPMLGMTIIVV